MTDSAEDRDALLERNRRLEKELRAARREARQMHRAATRAETMALRSKQAILGTNRELQDTVRSLESLTGELELAKQRAERASEAKGRFVATISHELRTPMNGILGTAELLMEAGLSQEHDELVRIVHRSAHGLLSIIKDVLDFTKAETGRIELEQTRFDLHSMLQAVGDLQLNAARRKNIELRIEVQEGLPRWVLGDPVRLRQVLLNLLDNAIKFTSEGQVELCAEVVEGEESRIRFSVLDSGIGIPEDVLESIFNPFTQADSSTTRRFGGSGLGLAICRHLAGLMGGELSVQSEAGVGSCFSLESVLPETASRAGDKRAPRSQAAVETALGQRVLVVDDNAVNRLIACRMLERLGCTYEVAENGLEATRWIADHDFDAVLMDCSMPELDGYEATRVVRGMNGPRARVRIVAMTAHALSGDRERCLSAGMDDYLCKPMQIADLRRVLESADGAASERPARPDAAA